MPFHFVFRFFPIENNHLFPLESVKKIMTRPFRRNCRRNRSCEIWFFCKFLTFHTGKKLPQNLIFQDKQGSSAVDRQAIRTFIKINSNISRKWDTSDEFFLSIFSTPPESCVPVQWSLQYRCIFVFFFELPTMERVWNFLCCSCFQKKNGLPFEGKWHQHFFSDRYFGLGPRTKSSKLGIFLQWTYMRLRLGNWISIFF